MSSTFLESDLLLFLVTEVVEFEDLLFEVLFEQALRLKAIVANPNTVTIFDFLYLYSSEFYF